MPASEADDQVPSLGAGAVAEAQCEVVELGGNAGAARGEELCEGWTRALPP
ncbi:hypothetical protein [Streptomyces sp. NPDC048636]|uniref:hypothetical protein n=1 Tax=Streptomyces sp. NPDC048636 TaxID=3155762 RepID=UPI003447FE8B